MNPSRFREFGPQIIDYIHRFYDENRYTPSIRDIASALSISKSSVYNYLTYMRDNGSLDFDENMIITAQMQDRFSELTRVRMLGSVPCGSLALEEENAQDYFEFPVHLLGHGEFFLLETYGDSMTGAGIDPGDAVIVRRQSRAADGDLAVVYVEGEGNTLKRFRRDEKSQRVILHPENPKYKDIVVKDCTVQGVVVRIIKKVQASG